MGISRDRPDGRVIELPKKLDEQAALSRPLLVVGSKKVEGVVTSAVPIDTRQTFCPHGDWVAAACWSGVLIGVLAERFRRPLTKVST